MARRRSWTIRPQDGEPGPGESAGQPCARGHRCEERDYQGNPKYGPRAFCETDARSIRQDILALPMHYAALRGLLAYASQAGERVSGSKEPPIPLAADVEAFMREIVHVTCSWEDAVRAAARLADPPEGRRRDGVMLGDAVRTLAGEYRRKADGHHEMIGGHFGTLMSLESQHMRRAITRRRVEEIIEEEGDAIDPGRVIWDVSGQPWEALDMDGTAAGLEFLALNGRARGMLGLSRQRRSITEVRCDTCKGKTLVQYEGRDGGWEPVAKCTNCPEVYSGQRFDWLMRRVYEAQVEALDAAGRKRQESS